ncbi:MAG TPA: hypothetical protein VK154_15260 [Chitinophagales bacterium]|nr:hypothetical protein [Chitinophagales bacterium]
MNISQLQTDIAAIDRVMLAVKYMVTPRYVDMLLLGLRPAKTEVAKAIISEYELLQRENYTWILEMAHQQGLELEYDD